MVPVLQIICNAGEPKLKQLADGSVSTSTVLCFMHESEQLYSAHIWV